MQPRQYYREYWALKNVSFEVKKGETLGVIGRNGCGKSTLLQMICGTLNPSAGSIKTEGRLAALLELGSGFNPEFTGRENVYLNGALLGLTRGEIDARFKDIAEFAGIGDFIDQPVKTYSSGMYVRLAFAIQANVDPEILIVDEALAVGDAYFVHKCMLRFNQLQNAGTTIIFVSHDALSVKTLCQKGVWLENGQLKYFGDASIAVDRYQAAINNQPLVQDFGRKNLVQDDTKKESVQGLASNREATIPNIDRRLGDQRCVFVGLGMYDAKHSNRETFENNSKIFLRLTIRNNSLKKGEQLIIGYCLRNSRGIDIASNNSKNERVNIEAPEIGMEITIRVGIHVPILHPGSYSFSITMAYWINDDQLQDSDSITNAIVFDLTSEQLVHVLMSLESTFELEPSC